MENTIHVLVIFGANLCITILKIEILDFLGWLVVWLAGSLCLAGDLCDLLLVW